MNQLCELLYKNTFHGDIFMKSNFFLNVVIIFCFIGLSACSVALVPSSHYMSYVEQHQGKTKTQLIDELSTKYEGVCTAVNTSGFCYSEFQFIERSHLVTQIGNNEITYYSYRRPPALHGPNIYGGYQLFQQGKLKMNLNDEAEAFDIMGFLMRIYEIEKDNP